MAEPLKNQFGPDVPERIASMISAVSPDFEVARFLSLSLDGYDDLELTPRARQIASAMAETLPENRAEALDIVVRSFGPELEGAELTGMAAFLYLPHVFFIAEYGLDHFEEAMRAQHEVTRRFTAEFSIRAYLERYPDETLDRLRAWSSDPSVHVRRLVSEGTRPRLPWAPRLKDFQRDPSPVLDLLERLKDDPEEYVRRSVANNLNDIAKDHPEVVVDVARRWWKDGDRNRRRLVRHGLRTLIKAANPDALDVLGFGPDSPARVADIRCSPTRVAIGERVRIEIDVENPAVESAGALVDFRVHFVKANGTTSPKVFKGGEVELEAGASTTVKKTVSLRQHSTRTHYPGRHRVDVLLNGVTVDGPDFDVVA
ncbi:MAG: DNA alkylation repair protein [Gemmatimonadota bacterium]